MASGTILPTGPAYSDWAGSAGGELADNNLATYIHTGGVTGTLAVYNLQDISIAGTEGVSQVSFRCWTFNGGNVRISLNQPDGLPGTEVTFAIAGASGDWVYSDTGNLALPRQYAQSEFNGLRLAIKTADTATDRVAEVAVGWVSSPLPATAVQQFLMVP